jgi:hypothetical protein
MRTGTTGIPARMGRINRVGLNSPIFPSEVRVPSGKTTIEIPFLSKLEACRRLASPFLGFARSIEIWRDLLSAQPMKGMRKISAFVMMRKLQGIYARARRISRKLEWLGIKI